MRDYSRVHTAFWVSDDVRKLTEDGRTLALYLLTSPHSNMIGCFRLPEAYACEDLQWSTQRVSKGFDDLSNNGFATHDKLSKWVVIHRFMKWNPIENPNQGKAAIKLFDQVSASSTIKNLCAKAFLDFSCHVDIVVYEQFLNPLETVSESGTGTGTGTGTGAGYTPRGLPFQMLKDENVDEQIINDFLKIRTAKRAPFTKTALDGIKREAEKAKITTEAALRVCIERGWQSFKAEWFQNKDNQTGKRTPKPDDFANKDYSKGINEDGSF